MGFLKKQASDPDTEIRPKNQAIHFLVRNIGSSCAVGSPEFFLRKSRLFYYRFTSQAKMGKNITRIPIRIPGGDKQALQAGSLRSLFFLTSDENQDPRIPAAEHTAIILISVIKLSKTYFLSASKKRSKTTHIRERRIIQKFFHPAHRLQGRHFRNFEWNASVCF